jgi:hypothetical protein
MSQTIVTHYAPWDAAEDFAYCGLYLNDDPRYHSPQPTCPVCAAKLAAECAIDEAIETTAWPLDADEANAVLDPVLNAGVPETPTKSPLGEDLFQLGVTLNRIYANHFPPEARLFAGRRRR